jgi:hypothetical protein
MNNRPPTYGRKTREYPDIFPWNVRPGFRGGGSIRTAHATVTCTATSLTDPLAVTVDGTPVPLTGDKLPELSVDRYPKAIGVSVAPTSISSLVSHGEVSRQAFWGGSSTTYLQFYQGGQKIEPAYFCGSSSGSCTCRYSAYNYEYGQNNIGIEGFVFYQLGGQAWPPPYVPDSVAANIVVAKCSLSISLKVMILWEA